MYHTAPWGEMENSRSLPADILVLFTTFKIFFCTKSIYLLLSERKKILNTNMQVMPFLKIWQVEIIKNGCERLKTVCDCILLLDG